jgi:DNA-binding MarR family transcriptional regulator
LVATLKRRSSEREPIDKDDALTALLDAAHVIERSLELQFAEIGLGAAQQRVLQLLLHDETLAPTQIALLLSQEPQSVSSLLIRLEQRGLIVRAIDGGDRRRLVVSLTEEGRSIAERSLVLLGGVLDQIRTELGDEGLAILGETGRIFDGLSR